MMANTRTLSRNCKSADFILSQSVRQARIDKMLAAFFRSASLQYNSPTMAESTPPDAATTRSSETAAALAAAWLARLDQQQEGEPAALGLPPALATGELGAALAALAVRIMDRGMTLAIVVADDEAAPAIAAALDPSLRPLCLMLPAADFAVRIVVRTTLALLKNGLTRGDPADGQVWNRQQQRIDADPQTWQRCLQWSDKPDGDAPWPQGIARLFPLRVVAAARLAALAGVRADFAVVVAPASAQGIPAARCLLLQTHGRPASLRAGDDAQVLQAQLAILAQELGHMEMELVTVQAEVGEFARSYHERVGRLMAELDALEAEMAAKAAQQAGDDTTTAATDAAASASRAERSRREQARFEEAEPAAAPPFRSSSALKRIYRQVAQKIHPDRAVDEADRTRRTVLMSEANRAYRAADEAALREVLERWREGEASGPAAPAAVDVRLQLERLKHRLAEIQSELHRIFASRLYELFVAARLARRRGRDLLEEMAADLLARIAAAKRALE
jgi:hypothetical protein